MESVWQSFIPDSLLYDIFLYLDVQTLGLAAQVCTAWHRVAGDDLLWHSLSKRIWKIKGKLAPGKTSWYKEMKRLMYHVPSVCSETIAHHTDEVLDVAISHNGQYFCTSSKDALITMWELGAPSCVLVSFDAGLFLEWQLSQYSTFSPDDSYILVCGVKSYDEIPVDLDTEYRTGVGAIFTVPGLAMVTVVEMDPPTMFGAWLNETTFLGGWPGSRMNTVDIQAYKITDKVSNAALNIVQRQPHLIFSEVVHSEGRIVYERFGIKLFSFRGNRYHLMNLLVANVPNNYITASCSDVSCDRTGSCDSQTGGQSRKRTPPFDECFEVPEARKVKVRETNSRDSRHDFAERLPETETLPCHIDQPVNKLCDTYKESNSSNQDKLYDTRNTESSSTSTESSSTRTESSSTRTEGSPSSQRACILCDTGTTESSSSQHCLSGNNLNLQKEEEMISGDTDKIFSTPKQLQPGSFKPQSVKAIDENNCAKSQKKQYIAFVTGNHDVIAVNEVTHEKLFDLFEKKPRITSDTEELQGVDVRPPTDKIDHQFTVKDCYITGLCLSHDHRNLYFNFRELDKNAPENKVDAHIDDSESEDEFPLPVSEKVFCKDLKIGCIDLVAMQKVKNNEYVGHVGYSSFPAWYICLDASPDYIASGSEDMRGYIWDRHYGVCVSKLFHSPIDTGDNSFLVMSLHEVESVVNGFAFSPVDQETCITVCDDKLIKIWRSKYKLKSLSTASE